MLHEKLSGTMPQRPLCFTNGHFILRTRSWSKMEACRGRSSTSIGKGKLNLAHVQNQGMTVETTAQTLWLVHTNTAVPRCAADENRAFKRNFKRVLSRFWSILFKYSNRRQHLAFPVRSWRQGTNKAEAIKSTHSPDKAKLSQSRADVMVAIFSGRGEGVAQVILLVDFLEGQRMTTSTCYGNVLKGLKV